MLASDLSPVTPENFNAVTDAHVPLVIDGIVFRPGFSDAGRPVWKGADGRTVRLSRLDDIMDAEVPVFFFPRALASKA